ncbi:MAG: response regulator [Candidatus Krumholzibacteria bacterium]|nr:response regulator [Candidatus Krumholzibacteria bacterium]
MPRIVLLVLSLALISGIAGAQQEFVFQTLTVDDGLPDNTVRTVIQDQRGFMWFGTQGGLARFDGREMRIFQPVPGDSTSIGGRLVNILFEDSRGRIWVGTILNGLSRYNPLTESFTRFVSRSDGGVFIPPTWIRDISEDSHGSLWVATGESSLYRVDGETGIPTRIIPGPHWPQESSPRLITRIMVDSRDQVWISTRSGRVFVTDLEGRRLEILNQPTSQADGGLLTNVEKIIEDSSGRIWIAGYGGLLGWNPKSRELTSFLPDLFNADAGVNQLINLIEDKNGVLWIGSVAGLLRFDPRYSLFRLFKHDSEVSTSIGQGPVMGLWCDESGLIWTGMWNGSVSRFDPNGSLFLVYQHSPNKPGSLHINSVRSVLSDRQGTIWIATGTPAAGPEVGGLNRLEPGGITFDHIPLPRADLHVIEYLAEGPGDLLWLGTNKGLWTYDRARGTYAPHRPGDPDLLSLASNSVRKIFVDDDGSLWLGTRNLGLWQLNPDGALGNHFPPDPGNDRGIAASGIIDIFRDQQGRLWIGTETSGLYLYFPESNDFQHFFDPQGRLFSVSKIENGPDGRLWISSMSGLILFDPDIGIVETFTSRNGLPHDDIATFVMDNRRRLWLSTGRGLALLDPVTRDVHTFDTHDGLPTNENGYNAYLDPDGTAYLPTFSGLVSFRPDQYVSSTFEPKLVLTGLKLYDEPLIPGEGEILERSVTDASSITLDHDQNVLTFSFASLDFGRPDLHRYHFRLEGFDPGWRNAGPERQASYTNLPPGRYTFEVRGTNSSGVWSPKTASIDVLVNHPWWASPLSYALYIIIFIAALALFFRTLLRRAHHVQLLKMRQAEVEKLEELDRVKSRFFANISHEFRTPLTLIEGLLLRARKQQNTMTADNRKMILANTRRLRELIDKLLDLARIESGQFNLKWTNGDIISFLRALSSPFEYVADARNITFTVEFPAGDLEGWFDRDLVETVVSNLLSNALKYTPEGERVDLILEIRPTRVLPVDDRDRMGLSGAVDCRDLTISVANTGTYVSAEDRDRIFDRFLQATASDGDGNVGTGIGLALVKELVEFMGGAVEVTSSLEKKTAFTVTFPLVGTPVAGASVMDAGSASETGHDSPELLEERISGYGHDSAYSRPADREPEPGHGSEPDEPDSLPLVLVVEDHADLRSFLAAELEGGNRIITAADGVEGLEAARGQVPDLVVSDVMMPNMDGFEMLTRLKEDSATSHIPVVMLTAKAEAGSRKQGLRIGADDYLAKPLDPEELRIRVKNLIDQRILLRHKYSSNIDLLPIRSLPLVNRDDRFLARAMTVVDENLENEDFSVEDFAREVGLSRTQLHRKLKALTGKSATFVVRRQRLRRAAELLASGYGNVAEVAFACGFKSLSHFSRNFKDEFGVAPSQYRKSGG